MTNEELLRPRWKVIADYPKSLYHVGDILNGGWRSEDCIYCDTDGPRWRHYPHLFRPLEWWEERKAEDMPEYIRFNKPAREKYYIRKVDAIKETHMGKYVACCGSERYYLGSKDFPATEAEYLAALNTTKQQDNG